MSMHEIDRLKSALQSLESGRLTPEQNRLLGETITGLLPLLESGPTSGNLASRLQAASQGQRLSAELDALRSVTRNLTSSLDLQQVLRSVLSAVLSLVKDVRDAHIFLYDAGKLTFGTALFNNGQEETPFTNVRPQGLTYTVARLARMLVVEDMTAHPLFKDTSWSGSIVGLPLKIGLRVVGVLTAYRSQPGPFNEDDQRLLQILAEYASIAVENSRLQGLVDRQAQLDALTGLHNRHSLEEKLEEEVHRYTDTSPAAGSSGRQRTFSLLMIELDGLQQINEHYGRPAGDHVIKEVAFSISQALRKTDFLARYSGELMAAILADTDREMSLSVAGRIQEYAAASRFNLPDTSQKALVVSVGIALFPEHGSTAEEILAAAGAALQQVHGSQPGSAAFAVSAPG